MSIPLVFFCALLNLALGYQAACRLGYGQRSPALRWSRGNLLIAVPSPLIWRFAWWNDLQVVGALVRRRRRASRLPAATVQSAEWYDVSQQWLQKLLASISAVDDSLLHLAAGDDDARQTCAAALRQLSQQQGAAANELAQAWRRWRKGLTLDNQARIDAQLKALTRALRPLAQAANRIAQGKADAAMVTETSAQLAAIAAPAHALRDELWRALTVSTDETWPQAWQVDPLTSWPTMCGFRAAAAERTDQPIIAVGLRLSGLAEINARHGVRVGDRVVRGAALAVRQRLSAETLAVRMDGTTLVWLATEDSLEAAERSAEAACASANDLEFEAGGETLHAGARASAVMMDADWNCDDLLSSVDEALARTIEQPAAAAS